MPRKRHRPEQILHKLREVEVALSQGETVARAVRQIAGICQNSALGSNSMSDWVDPLFNFILKKPMILSDLVAKLGVEH